MPLPFKQKRRDGYPGGPPPDTGALFLKQPDQSLRAQFPEVLLRSLAEQPIG